MTVATMESVGNFVVGDRAIGCGMKFNMSGEGELAHMAGDERL